ncbi:hypothetical protein BHM03_00048301 [Ensete ventricosum]|nr:hypothetical protein BHM03_00048301 [Ensete ventricosum]
MNGTYWSANLLAHGPLATDTILLPGSWSQDGDPNISILREEKERERERERKGDSKGEGWVVRLKAGQVRGRATELAERDATATAEGD